MMRFSVIVNAVLVLMAGISISSGVQAQNVLGAGMYDSNTPLFAYSAGWSEFAASKFLFGSIEYTTTNTAWVEFYVFGQSFTIYGEKAPTNSSNVSLCIDDICQAVSFQNATTFTGAIITISGLDYGTTKVELINNTSQQMNIDAVFVEDYQVEPTVYIAVQITAILPETTAEPTPAWQIGGQVVSGESSQETVYEYRVTTGDQQIAGWLFALIITNVILIALTAWNSWRSSG